MVANCSPGEFAPGVSGPQVSCAHVDSLSFQIVLNTVGKQVIFGFKCTISVASVYDVCVCVCVLCR